MESSRGRGGREGRPGAFDRDLDVELGFDRFGESPTSAADELELPEFVRAPGRDPEGEAEAPPAPPRRRPRGEPAARRDRQGPIPRGPAPKRRRPRSETLARVLWALPWIVVVIAIVAVGGLPFAAAMAVFACIGLIELFRMTSAYRPLEYVAFVVAVGMIAAAYYGDQYQLVLAGAAAFPLMFLVAAARGIGDGITRSMAITTFGLLWIGIPFAHAVLLRELPLHGGALLIDVLVATFVADTCAYAGGRLFGRHPLAPAISPNKTLEGLAAGFVGGTMGFWFAGLYQDWLSGLDALVMGMVIAALAPMGDLFESLVKRDLGVKDSGNVFGPHGGLLDRLDAVIFTIVAGYYLSVAFVY